MKNRNSLFKHLLLIIICLQISAINTRAQSSTNYTFETGNDASLNLDVNGNSIDMTNANVLILANVNNSRSAITNIGFAFFFMGEHYTQFSLNDNGVLSLGATPVDMNTW